MTNQIEDYRKDQDEIERMIDKHGLAEVLSMIALVCWAKADHVQSNWQDKPLARAWERTGKKIDRIRIEV